jgi:pyruvate, orthophosphate dikinase
LTSIYAFDHAHGRPAKELGDLLGGKGAGLAEMTSALGLSVPPGFTVAVPVCAAYRADGWPAGLDAELATAIDRLGAQIGRRLGDPADPLLLAVRSGAPVSMPGMLDTVLDLGLNDETVVGLAERSGDPAFAWDSYRRFVTMFATLVMGVDAARLPSASAEAGPDALRAHVGELLARVEELAGRPVPHDPHTQLRESVEAVFRSWDCDRARAYRRREGIAEELGTAVNVQAMVFGNRGEDSGTGVVFTRNPSTGEAAPYGDYLARAQGEDVVAGSSRTEPVAHLAEHAPAAYAELVRTLRRLEVHYRDVCDVEFTVESGRLWLLQTRIGKRGAVAAVRIAVALVDDEQVALTEQEALDRVPSVLRERARAEVAASGGTGDTEALLTVGLGASPGCVTGAVVLDLDAAADAEGDVILVRKETSPEDVAAMAASVGVLTTRGGLVSHAAVVARGWGIPAVVGADAIEVRADGLHLPDGRFVAPGETITVDGTSGAVWLGAVQADEGGEPVEELLARLLPELERLESWERDHSGASA